MVKKIFYLVLVIVFLPASVLGRGYDKPLFSQENSQYYVICFTEKWDDNGISFTGAEGCYKKCLILGYDEEDRDFVESNDVLVFEGVIYQRDRETFTNKEKAQTAYDCMCCE